MTKEQIDSLRAVKLEVRRAARSLEAIGLKTEANVLDQVALHVQREIETIEQMARAAHGVR